MIDIGVNLTNKSFHPDQDAVIRRAVEAGIEQMVVTGTDLEASTEAADLAARYPGLLYSTAGVHPHDARSCNETTIDRLRKLAARPEVVAIGECGLDFNRNYSPPDVQIVWFERQLDLSIELGMPLFLHERDAFETMYELLKPRRSQIKAAVIHCFTGSHEALEAYLDLDLHIGITGWICDERRGLELQELVRHIPSDRLMLETDAPYLLPRTIEPKPQSRRNEPAFLTYVLETVAACRGEAMETVAKATTQTAKAFFGLGK
jgi:TatD DNase family protein